MLYSSGDHELVTAAWLRVAGMLDLVTYHHPCRAMLTRKELSFQWPAGVIRVALGFEDPIVKPGPENMISDRRLRSDRKRKFRHIWLARFREISVR